MLYLAADEPLKKVEWDDADPGFHTALLGVEEAAVQGQFSKRHVLYAGGHEGCGCGFQANAYARDADDDPKEVLARRRSLDQLRDYLQAELARVGVIEVYACWDGDQATPPRHRRTLTASSLASGDFVFLEGERSTLVARS
jgi:hypothetical protein